MQVQIRESIVSPLCQDVSIQWMMAEKDDWIPQSVVPVAFSAVPNPENERQSSKHNLGVQPKPVEENDNSVQPLLSHNGEDKPQTLQISESPSSIGHGSTSAIPSQSQSYPYGPSILQMQLPTIPHSQSTHREVSGTSKSQPRSSGSSEHSSSEHSFPSRPSGASLHLSAPASIREEDESDLTEPLLDNDDLRKEKLLGLRSESDAGASDRHSGRPLDTDLLQQSEGLGLESESQNPSNQVLMT